MGKRKPIAFIIDPLLFQSLGKKSKRKMAKFCNKPNVDEKMENFAFEREYFWDLSNVAWSTSALMDAGGDLFFKTLYCL